jgi:hypothetical protein
MKGMFPARRFSFTRAAHALSCRPLVKRCSSLPTSVMACRAVLGLGIKGLPVDSAIFFRALIGFDAFVAHRFSAKSGREPVIETAGEESNDVTSSGPNAFGSVTLAAFESQNEVD